MPRSTAPLPRSPSGTGRQTQDVEIIWDRPILMTRIAAPFGPLHVLNLHLRAPRAAPFPQARADGQWRSVAAWAEGYYLAALKRQGQALEARLMVDQWLDANPDAAIAVCGDLNADLYETPLRILRADLDDTGAPGFAWRALQALEEKLPPDQRYSVLHAGRRLMLDHLLVSRVLAQSCIGASIDHAGLTDEALAQTLPDTSFHAPMYAQFLHGQD